MRIRVPGTLLLLWFGAIAASLPGACRLPGDPQARAAAAAEDRTGVVATVLARQLANLGAIKSIVVDGQDVRSEPGKSGSDSQVTREKWTVSGERFRVEYIHQTRAFDGIRHYTLDAKDGTVFAARTSASSPPMWANPIMAVYGFAVRKGGELTLPYLQRPSTWEKLARTVQSVRDATMMGHPGVVIEFYGPTQYGMWRNQVFFASDMDYFPLQQTARLLVDGEGEGTHKVVSVKEFTGEHGTFRIPTRVEGTGLAPDGKVSEQWHQVLDPATLQVNKPIPDDVFRLSAPGVWYVDSDTDLAVMP